MEKKEKNISISNSLKETRERRKNQLCRVVEVKVDKSKMNKQTETDSKLIFLEAKWLRNFIISQNNIFNADYKLKEVEIKVADKFEKREIKTLGSQIRQGVVEKIKEDIINLSKSKKKGNKVGKLKFISRCDSIDLKQFGTTYRIKGNRIKIQGIKQYFRVSGLKQLEMYDEIANAKFIQKGGDYFFHITCFIDKDRYKAIKEEKNPPVSNKTSIGIDFGLSHQMTISNLNEGIFIDYQVDFPKRLKTLYRDLSRKKKYSENWYKQLNKIQKEFSYTTNCKEDVKNKLFNIFNSEFKNIFYQNDNFRGWQRIWWRKMLSIGLGGLTARLKNCATADKIDRFFPSTKKCSCCHDIQDVALDERIYNCKSCGHTQPRDCNSSDNISIEGLKKIGVEYTDFKPAEMKPLLSILDRLNSIPRVKASSVCETGSLRIYS